jgi:hypothetical protein
MWTGQRPIKGTRKRKWTERKTVQGKQKEI